MIRATQPRRAAPVRSKGLLGAAFAAAAALAACSSGTTVPNQEAQPTSVPCGGGPACTDGTICAIVLGAPTCQPAPDCQVFCVTTGDAGVPNSCAIDESVCPDESVHNKVFEPGATTCSGTGTSLVINCAYQ